MNNLLPFPNNKLMAFSLLILLAGCHKEEVAREQKPQPLNSFSMTLNGQPWHPSMVGNDECMRTFNGEYSALLDNSGEKTIYTIRAYKDPQARTTYESENAFKFQITDVQGTGKYAVTGSYQEALSSYAVFTINQSNGTVNRYVNQAGNLSFVVEVTETIPIVGSGLKGIKGSFYGTLYNEANPLDSLFFQKGEFTLKRINWYDFNQCAQ